MSNDANMDNIVYTVLVNGTNYTETCTWFKEATNNQTLTIFDIPEICRIKYPLAMSIFIGLTLTVMCCGSTLGNFLVILAVSLVKKLQTPSNLLIVSLAFSDLLVSILVMPLAIVQLLLGYWTFNEVLCNMFIMFDVLLCTASILNLCAISIDRYLVITKPLQYAVNRTPLRMGLMIAAVWLTSGLISIPPIITIKDPFIPGTCVITDNLGYQLYATLGAFYIPLLVMLVLYGRIFKLARQMALADAKQKLTSIVAKPEQHTDTVTTPLTVTPTTSAGVMVNSTDPSVRQIRFTNAHTDDGETVVLTTAIEGSNGPLPNGSLQGAEEGNDNGQGNPSSGVAHKGPVKPKSNSDSKAIKTLGVIMGCFTLCWLPFFIIQITTPFLKLAHYKPVDLWIFELFLWLGYLNSFLNPVIYAKFNREFRTPFKEILMFHCKSINNRLRSESYAEQYGLPMNNLKRKDNDSHVRKRAADVFVNVSKKGRMKSSMVNGSRSGMVSTVKTS